MVHKYGENRWNGQWQSNRKEPSHSVALSNTNITWTAPGLNLASSTQLPELQIGVYISIVDENIWPNMLSVSWHVCLALVGWLSHYSGNTLIGLRKIWLAMQIHCVCVILVYVDLWRLLWQICGYVYINEYLIFCFIHRLIFTN